MDFHHFQFKYSSLQVSSFCYLLQNKSKCWSLQSVVHCVHVLLIKSIVDWPEMCGALTTSLHTCSSYIHLLLFTVCQILSNTDCSSKRTISSNTVSLKNVYVCLTFTATNQSLTQQSFQTLLVWQAEWLFDNFTLVWPSEKWTCLQPAFL